MAGLFLALSLAAVLCGSGCGKAVSSDNPARERSASDTNFQTFTVKGLVLEVDPADKTVRIKHDAVAGYMPAMTMPFEVKDTNELAGLEPGDPVSFRLNVTATEGWIDQIRITGPKTNNLPATGAFRVVRDVEPLKEGDLLPDYAFTNELDRPFSTRQFKGQALAIEFLFTRCPYPTFCPLMAGNFEKVQNLLLARANGPTNWHLLTISFDPEFDTPAVLKAYAESHHYDPSRWTFATGELIDITAIAEQFGLAFWHDETGGISHNLRTAVIDASGRVQRTFAGNRWTPEELAAEMVKAAQAR